MPSQFWLPRGWYSIACKEWWNCNTFNRLSQKILHTKCKILDTRKTTPGFRYPEKWAVSIGGGYNHRMGLFDAIIIKDNHADFWGLTKLWKTKAYLIKCPEIPVIVEKK